MGYLNKTCTAGTLGRSYGPTVGPVLRGAAGVQWKGFTINVVGTAFDGHPLITIHTYWPAGKVAPL
jgi:hypothetical protein